MSHSRLAFPAKLKAVDNGIDFAPKSKWILHTIGALFLIGPAIVLWYCRRFQPPPMKLLEARINMVAYTGDEKSGGGHATPEAPSGAVSTPPSVAQVPVDEAEEAKLVSRETGDRLQRLKELAWTKEVKDDITYAEFALTINPTAPGGGANSSADRTVSGIDYFKIADKLDVNLERMERKDRWTLDPGDIDNLMQRLRATKESIDVFMAKAHKLEEELEEDEESKKGSKRSGKPKDQKEESPDEKKMLLKRPLELFVREDGTVDWDGAIERGRELAVFGTEVWERLNGRAEAGEEDILSAGLKPTPNNFARIDEQPTIVALKARVEALEASLAEALRLRDQKQQALWTARSQGQPVTAETRLEMRAAAQSVLEFRRRLAVQKLDLDMERICLYLEQEIEQSSSLQDQKMLVAEFGLLEKQLQTLLALLGEWDNPGVIDDIDETELEVLQKEISDLKLRLGGDFQGTIDWGKAVTDFWKDNASKLSEGVAFCIKGTRLLLQDILYALWLFKRTMEGYNLKPREVRTIRRTVKDILTFIPALIILLIPLSPVGHVLVFSFIQRFFPDFFPTPWSDRRQNLLKMYEEIERKVPDDSPGQAQPR